MKKYLIYYTYLVFSRRRKFSHISKLKIKSFNNMRYMNYKYHLKQPMQMIEQRTKMIIAKYPQLINSLDRDGDHPLITTYIHIPFND